MTKKKWLSYIYYNFALSLFCLVLSNPKKASCWRKLSRFLQVPVLLRVISPTDLFCRIISKISEQFSAKIQLFLSRSFSFCKSLALMLLPQQITGWKNAFSTTNLLNAWIILLQTLKELGLFKKPTSVLPREECWFCFWDRLCVTFTEIFLCLFFNI